MVQSMFRQSLFLFAIALGGPQGASGDTIQLKDKAAITGKILAEKRDQVAVDVGYTVLVIPRSQIVRISKSDDLEAAASAKPLAAPKPALIPTASHPLAE